MVKKLTGQFYIYSANDLQSGEVVYFSRNSGWVNAAKLATIFNINEILDFNKKIKDNDFNYKIVNPYLVEVCKKGRILKLREKIRLLGINILGQLHV